MDTKIKICPKCGTKTELFYCPNCGEVFEYPSFVGNNEKRKHSLQEFIKKVVSVAKQQRIDVSSAIDGSPVRNAIYRKYYEQIAYLQKLCSNKTTQSYFMNSGSNMFDQMNSFAEKCELGECQIAVVGTVKAGKSMFINSLIGKEVASSYPTPETASVTKFRKSEKGEYVKISFYTSKEWMKLWNSVNGSTSNSIEGDENEDFLSLYKFLNAESIKNKYLNKEDLFIPVQSQADLKDVIDKFTSARYAEHFFAKEVEVGLMDFFATSNVVIVDTPGLDDPVPYRTDITRRYLHKANVVLLCIRSNRPEISSTELKQLSNIFAELRYSKERIYTIGTQIDEPDNMLDYWSKYTLPEYLKYLSRSSIYGDKEIAEAHIFPVTAYYYLLLKKVIENPNLLNSKNESDLHIRKAINEIVRRYFEVPELSDLIEEYGTDEALKKYKSPRQIFDEHKDELLRMTQVPDIRNLLISGPIKNANDIILNDIKDLYIHLTNELRKIADDISVSRQETIELSKANDALSNIKVLERTIVEKKKSQKEQANILGKIFSELENTSKKELNRIKY